MALPTFTVVQVSDLHLDPADSALPRRMAALRQRVAEAGPDLVVVTGDVSADGFRRPEQLEPVRAELARLGPHVLVIPGNHDVGDKPGEAQPLRPEHLDRWRAVFGSDRFCVARDGWRLLGLDTQLLGSGLREEAEQFDWLDGALASADAGGEAVALYLHFPPYLLAPDEDLSGFSRYWGIDAPTRRQLAHRVHHRRVRLVCSGHLHWHQVFQRGGAVHVWCPSASFVVDDAIFPRGGGLLGAMRYRFGADSVCPELLALEGPPGTIFFHRPQLELPGRPTLVLTELLLDFTGTLSRDGQLLAGVAGRLTELARRIPITVLTADTFGRAAGALAGLPVQLHLIETGADKQRYIEQRAAGPVVAIGNGRNDVPMLKAAALGIAVLGPEGSCAELLQCADVLARDIVEALDLLLNPLRLKATLRA